MIGRISNQSILNRDFKFFFFGFVILISNPMYSADFDFYCKSHFGGFCDWFAVLKFKSFDGAKLLNSQIKCLRCC